MPIPTLAATTAPIDTTYQKLPNETVDQYNSRISAYNANKPPPTAGTTAASANAAPGKQDQSNAANAASQANAGKPGYDVFGNPTGTGGTDLQTVRQNSGTYTGIDGNLYYKYDSSPATSSATVSPPSLPSTGNASLDALEQQRQQDAAAFSAAGEQVSTAILNIQNGVTPLTAGEQAQIQGLQQQFQQLIDQQILQNKGATGLAQTRGYQTGSAEYDPTFQAKTIASIVSAGANKVAGLQSQEADAVAKLTQGFRDNDIKAIQDAYSAYQDAYKARTDALNSTIADAQGAIKDAQDAANQQQQLLQKQQEDNYTQIIKPIQDIAADAAKNGAPVSILQAITAAKDPGSAAVAAGTFLQTPPTGDVGDYMNYVKMAQAANQMPIGYFEYLRAKTNATTKATSAQGSGGSTDLTAFSPKVQSALASSGFTSYSTDTQNLAEQLVAGNIAPSDLSKRSTGSASYNDVLTAADKYSMATTGNHFNIAQANRDYKFANNANTQNTLNYLKSLIGTDDGNGNLVGGNLNELVSISNQLPGKTNFPALNDVNAWEKLQSGNVEYAQYQAVLTEVSDQVAKILQGGGTGSGTSDAKLQQAQNLFQSGFSKDQINGIVNSLLPLLKNRASSMIGDNVYLSDYADDFGIQQNTPQGSLNPVNNSIIQQQSSDPGNIGNLLNAASTVVNPNDPAGLF